MFCIAFCHKIYTRVSHLFLHNHLGIWVLALFGPTMVASGIQGAWNLLLDLKSLVACTVPGSVHRRQHTQHYMFSCPFLPSSVFAIMTRWRWSKAAGLWPSKKQHLHMCSYRSLFRIPILCYTLKELQNIFDFYKHCLLLLQLRNNVLYVCVDTRL